MSTQVVELGIASGGIRVCPCCKQQGNTIHIDAGQGSEHHSFFICTECIKNVTLVKIPFTSLFADKVPNYKKIAKNGENKTAKEIGGKVHPGSGAFDTKGDCSNSEWMVEEKYTTNKSFRLTTDIIEKAISQAIKQGKKMLLKLSIGEMRIGVMLWNDVLEYVYENTKDA